MIKIINSQKLIELYKQGYFPMAKNSYSEKISFYKPEKRFIIPINSFHIPKKLFSDFKKTSFNFKINHQFIKIIDNCSKINKKRKETWINPIIRNTYINLYKLGYAKSIECYDGCKIIGGLYGVHIGKCFFGESMFSLQNNTSKFCLLFLISLLKHNSFTLLDSQFFNRHLLQFGAYEITNKNYELKLQDGILGLSNFPESFNFQKSVSILQSLSHKS